MFGFRIINPQKLEKARGDRARSEIVSMGGRMFAEQDLYNWEKGKNLPRPEKIPYLCRGLGVSYEDITDEIPVSV